MNKQARHDGGFRRISVIGDIFPDSFAENICVTLKKMGYRVEALPINPVANTRKAYIRMAGTYLPRLFPRYEDYLSGKLFEKVIENEPDLVIATDPGTFPLAIEKIKKETNAIVVCWFTDPIGNLNRGYLLAAPYDMIFMKEPFMVDLFKDRLNKNSFYLPEACNPMWHEKIRLTKYDEDFFGCDISVAGNMYYYRALILEELMDYKIKVWGPLFPRWLNSPTRKLFKDKYVAREEKTKAFRAAKINLNTLNPNEIYGVNCRTFEIAGSAGFQIIDYRSGLKDLFEVEKEIVTFETIKELKDKVAYYLSHEDKRKEIAQRSYERAHREHTYEKRLTALIRTATERYNERYG